MFNFNQCMSMCLSQQGGVEVKGEKKKKKGPGEGKKEVTYDQPTPVGDKKGIKM